MKPTPRLAGGGTGPVTGNDSRAEVTRIIHVKVAEVMEATGCSRNDAIRQVTDSGTTATP